MLMENIAQIAAVNADFFCDLGKADLFLVMGPDIFAGILRYLPGLGELQRLVRAEQGTDRSMEGFPVSYTHLAVYKRQTYRDETYCCKK